MKNLVLCYLACSFLCFVSSRLLPIPHIIFLLSLSIFFSRLSFFDPHFTFKSLHVLQGKSIEGANSHYALVLNSVCWWFWFMIVEGWDSCCNPRWWKIGGWKIRSTLWAGRLLGHNNFMVKRIFLNCSWECVNEAYNMNDSQMYADSGT